MAKELREVSEALYPVPVVMVSCADKNGKANIITLAWVGVVCSSPATIGIAIRPGRYSHKLIEETREFVINIPNLDLIKETDFCGVVSGRDVDKFKETGLTESPASKVRPPLIKECPVNIECKLKQVLNLGVHDLFLGEVIAVHCDEEVSGDSGKMDYSRARPFVYNQGEYWSLGKKVGTYGFSKK
jgi:flavin reductase (DIM6/NTAB) family NADH-FMN oxidoreductase RutF